MWTRRRRAKAVALVGTTVAGLLLSGCGSALGGQDDSSLRAVAAFYPLEYVAARVGGEHVDVVTLTAPGVDAHDIELTVRQTAELSEADLLLFQQGLQPAVDEAVAQNGPDRIVEAGETVGLLSTEEVHAHEDGDEEDAHAGEGADGEHDHGDEDPHFWLDPQRMIALADKVRGELSEIDPANADDYAARFRGLEHDLEELDHAYADGLAHCRLDTVVVSHDAFGYLEKYGLHFEPIAGLTPDAEPSPAHLRELAELIEQEGVTTVFSETLASPAMAETLAEDLGIETGVLDPVEGLGADTADEDYVSLMQANLEALTTANGCA